MSLNKITCGVSTTSDLIGSVNGLIDLTSANIRDNGSPEILGYNSPAGTSPHGVFSGVHFDVTKKSSMVIDLVTTADITTEQWIYSDWVEAGNKRVFAIRLRSGNIEVFASADGSGSTSVLTAPINAGRVVIEVSYDLSEVYAFVNGVYGKATLSINSSANAETKLFGIKAATNTTLWFKGYCNYINIDGNLIRVTDRAKKITGSAGGSLTLNDYTYVTGYNPPSRPVTTGFDVVILAGQSNMVGRATLIVGDDDNYGGLNDVYQMGVDIQTVRLASNPLDFVDDGAGSMGLWLELVKGIKPSLTGRPILLLPVAKGGTGFITNQWNVGDSLFVAARRMINAVTLNPANKAVGFMWLQGETDADNENNNYLANISAMWAGFKSQCPAIKDDTPFIAAKIKGSTKPAYIPIINAALTSFVSSVQKGAITETSDLTLFDTFHFDAPSLRVIGQRMAEKFNQVK